MQVSQGQSAVGQSRSRKSGLIIIDDHTANHGGGAQVCGPVAPAPRMVRRFPVIGEPHLVQAPGRQVGQARLPVESNTRPRKFRWARPEEHLESQQRGVLSLLLLCTGLVVVCGPIVDLRRTPRTVGFCRGHCPQRQHGIRWRCIAAAAFGTRQPTVCLRRSIASTARTSHRTLRGRSLPPFIRRGISAWYREASDDDNLDDPSTAWGSARRPPARGQLHRVGGFRRSFSGVRRTPHRAVVNTTLEASADGTWQWHPADGLDIFPGHANAGMIAVPGRDTSTGFALQPPRQLSPRRINTITPIEPTKTTCPRQQDGGRICRTEEAGAGSPEGGVACVGLVPCLPSVLPCFSINS